MAQPGSVSRGLPHITVTSWLGLSRWPVLARGALRTGAPCPITARWFDFPKTAHFPRLLLGRRKLKRQVGAGLEGAEGGPGLPGRGQGSCTVTLSGEESTVPLMPHPDWERREYDTPQPSLSQVVKGKHPGPEVDGSISQKPWLLENLDFRGRRAPGTHSASPGPRGH